LTLWSAIAILLAVGLALVGYRASLGIWTSPAVVSPSAASGTQAFPAIPDWSAERSSKSEPSPMRSQMISRAIGPEMKAAQAALRANAWQEALEDLQAAERHQSITIFDKFKIHDFKAFTEFKLRKYKEAQADYEAALAARRYTPEEAARTLQVLFRLAAQNQQYSKAVEYGKEVADSSSASPGDLNVLAQLYYLQKDCKSTLAWADKALDASKRAGAPPKESTYQFKLQCASDAVDYPAMEDALVNLIELTNKTTYWNTLLRLERMNERDDHDLLMIYRVMYNTNAMNADSDYIEMAQLLRDAALPAEAAAVLDKAISTGVIKDEHKERAMRLLDAVQARADSARKELPQQEAESNASSVGDLDVKLGEVDYGYEEDEKSVEAITKGLRKGLVTHQDDAYVYLGLAQLKLKNASGAQRAFASLKDVPNLSPRTLQLWELYAGTLTNPAQMAEQAGGPEPRLGDRY
jgi:hypothetical protein